ncbi:hypothetical protein [Mumia zhuanghuii]|uniref:Uncharacterized protein n=1 Tax=Mumia zhuanghuii TaxID=2585211 RepID=A0A5C4MCX4_9ACTN|nr:hypothetical protein [Mumia zhuanghuii]TNC31315.1 hypothetical protein FHE65_32110 [Mumia zhuanghuii]
MQHPLEEKRRKVQGMDWCGSLDDQPMVLAWAQKYQAYHDEWQPDEHRPQQRGRYQRLPVARSMQRYRR